jgi:hypothetical protein
VDFIAGQWGRISEQPNSFSKSVQYRNLKKKHAYYGLGPDTRQHADRRTDSAMQLKKLSNDLGTDTRPYADERTDMTDKSVMKPQIKNFIGIRSAVLSYDMTERKIPLLKLFRKPYDFGHETRI